MEKIIMILLLVVCCRSANGQFYSVEKKTKVLKVDVLKEDSIECMEEEKDSDMIGETDVPEPVASVSDSLLAALEMVPPLEEIRIVSPFGIRKDPFTGKARQHKGIDLRAKHRYPVAMMFGKVLRTGYNSTAGNYVTLQHGDLTVSYCHLSKIIVKEGDYVYAGMRIGLTGSTGRSTGEHLHLTCRLSGKLIDPVLLLKIVTR